VQPLPKAKVCKPELDRERILFSNYERRYIGFITKWGIIMSDENTECKETILKFKESSLIQKLFDQFLIKENILRLANQSSFTFTEWFFDSVILFLFFLVIFYFADLMIWGINSATMVLMTIALVSIIEFIGANYSKVRRWLSSEEQTNKVLDNIVNIPSPELERKVDDLRFSSRCLNKLY